MSVNDLLDKNHSEERHSIDTLNFKLLGLGAVVFYTTMNVYFILENVLRIIGNKFQLSPYFVLITSNILAIIIVTATLRYYLPIYWKKVKDKMKNINSLLGIQIIVLVSVMILYRLLYPMIELIDPTILRSFVKYDNREYWNFLEYYGPVSNIICPLFILFVMFRSQKSMV